MLMKIKFSTWKSSNALKLCQKAIRNNHKKSPMYIYRFRITGQKAYYNLYDYFKIICSVF